MSIVTINNNKVLGRIKPVHSAMGFISTSVRSEIRWNRNILSHIDQIGMPYARLNGVGVAVYLLIYTIFLEILMLMNLQKKVTTLRLPIGLFGNVNSVA